MQQCRRNWKGYFVQNSYSYTIYPSEFQTDFEIFNEMDIDTDDNVLNNASLFSSLPDKNILRVRATGGFSIVNAKGERMHFDTIGMVNGDMSIYGRNFVVYGGSEPCEFWFLVDASEEFQCIADEGKRFCPSTQSAKTVMAEAQCVHPKLAGVR